MKIRIKGDSIRLRLSQTDVAKIGAGNAVLENTHFNDSFFSYLLVSHTEPTAVKTNLKGSQIRI